MVDVKAANVIEFITDCDKMAEEVTACVVAAFEVAIVELVKAVVETD